MLISRRAALGAAVAGISAGSAVSYFMMQHLRTAMRDRQLAMPAGQTLESAQLERLSRLPDFRLERQGGFLTPADLQGRWSFVYFGYTNCPEACPTTLSMLNRAQAAIRKQGLAPPRIVFVSVDPRRDTPQLLARYVENFGNDTLAATGDDAALRALTPFFGVKYQRNDQTDKAHYTVDHSAMIFVLTPDNRWLASFPPIADAPQVTNDTAKLMRAPWPPG